MSKSKLDQYEERIREAIGVGVSQTALADELGVARSTLQHFIGTRLGDPIPQQDGLSADSSTEFTEIPVINRDYTGLDELYVYPLGDVHIGSDAHAEDRWLEWLAYLCANPQATMLGTGDYLNSALKNSKSETYDETLRVGEAKRVLRKQLAPLAKAGRIDLLMPGNHEARIYKAVGDCPIEDVCDSLEVPYAKDAVVVRYHVGGIKYDVYVRHGTGGGQIGARAGRLQKQAQTLIADVYVSGHTHSQLVFPQEIFFVSDEGVYRRRQVFVSSGSFVNYESYAAAQGLAPQKIGAPRIRLDGTRHDVHVSI